MKASRGGLPLAFSAVLALALTGCNTVDRLQNIGKAPDLSPIQAAQVTPAVQPVSLPMPAPKATTRQPNSLWQSGSRAFFKDQRADKVGDILTVLIQIDDQARLNNSSTRSRNNQENAQLPGFLGLESNLARILPDEVNPSRLAEFGSTTSNVGTGKIQRDEKIELKVAALVSQVLPNGNMVIQGRQEVRVNFEVRELLIAGVIRPEDIASDNTISYEKIAEARISYGGRGQMTDVQQPRYGQQLFDIVFPF